MAIEDLISKQDLRNFVQSVIDGQQKRSYAQLKVPGSGLYSFGVKSITWPGATPDLTGITFAHGLGVDPGKKVWYQADGHLLSYVTNSTDATNVTFQAHCVTGNPALNSTDNIYWLAVA